MPAHSLAVSETLPYVLFMENYAPEDFWFSSPAFKRRERNSSLVILSPLAQIACQVRSRVSHNSSVTRIARSLLRGSPDLGLAIRALLSGCSILHPIIKYIKILIQNHRMSSVIRKLCSIHAFDFRSSPNNNKSNNVLKIKTLQTISARDLPAGRLVTKKGLNPRSINKENMKPYSTVFQASEICFLRRKNDQAVA